MFTTDENILEQISKNDTSYCNLKSEPDSPQDSKERPPTSILTYEVCIYTTKKQHSATASTVIHLEIKLMYLDKSSIKIVLWLILMCRQKKSSYSENSLFFLQEVWIEYYMYTFILIVILENSRNISVGASISKSVNSC